MGSLATRPVPRDGGNLKRKGVLPLLVMFLRECDMLKGGCRSEHVLYSNWPQCTSNQASYTQQATSGSNPFSQQPKIKKKHERQVREPNGRTKGTASQCVWFRCNFLVYLLRRFLSPPNGSAFGEAGALISDFHHDVSLGRGIIALACRSCFGTWKLLCGSNLRDKMSQMTLVTPGMCVMISGRASALPRSKANSEATSLKAGDDALSVEKSVNAPMLSPLI